MQKDLIVYAGDDECLFWALEKQLESHGYDLEWSKDATPIVEDWICDGCRLLILDADLTTAAGLEFLQSVKARDMGTPVIVITDNKTLTNVGVARLNGAETLFFKPLIGFEPLKEVIERAFSRLHRWNHVLHERAEAAKVRKSLPGMNSRAREIPTTTDSQQG